jgi:ribose/xylose/arabinose/galactoside ABC-type transport system permease subunit
VDAVTTAERFPSARVAGRATPRRAASGPARLVAIWLVLAVVLTASADNFLTATNFLNIGRAVSITGIAAVGLTVAVIAGAIDLAFPVVISIAAIALAQLDDGGVPWPLAVLAVLAIGAAVGAVNGAASRLLAIDALLVTLASYTILTGLLFMRTEGQTYQLRSGVFEAVGRGMVWEIPAPVIVFAVVALVGAAFLRLTVTGQEAYAVGANAVAAHLAGIGVLRVKMVALAFGGACAAAAGMLLASGGGQASTGVGDTYLLPVLAAVVLGGALLSGGGGTILETVLGVIILGTITNGMNLLSIDPFVQMIVQGAVLVAALGAYAWAGRR